MTSGVDLTNERASERPSVLLVDPYPLQGGALASTLRQLGWTTELSLQLDPPSIAERAGDVAIVLLRLRLRDARRAPELIAAACDAGARVLILTDERRRVALASCLEAGACGWLGDTADLDDLKWALERIANGDDLIGSTERKELLDRLHMSRERQRRELAQLEELTARERAILGALVFGHSAQQIADHDHVSIATVRTQIRSILRKLGVTSQLAAVARAHRYRDRLPVPQQNGKRRTDITAPDHDGHRSPE